MATEPLVLVININLNNTNYFLYKHGLCKATATTNNGFTYTVSYIGQDSAVNLESKSIDQTISKVYEQWQKLSKKELIVDVIAMKTALPGGYFLDDHLINDEFLAKLDNISKIAPISYKLFMDNYMASKGVFGETLLVAVSDSGFNKNKPDYTWNYPIMLDVADNNDIKKFGYHGLALESVVKQDNESAYKSYQKVIICNLDSLTSVTAIYNSVSVDSTIGYSELDGLIAPHQPGGIDFAAGLALSSSLGKDPKDMLVQLSNEGGLKGISGLSGDINELLAAESDGNHRAELAISMYVYSIRQAIARMAASLEGAEALVFTGRIAVSSPKIRQRIVSGLDFLQFAINPQLNNKCIDPEVIRPIHPRTRTHPILVVPNHENLAIYNHVSKINR